MHPWNDWYHCTAHTYGTWLRGDPRGWRARHHREHVDGDYKNPPPRGSYNELFKHSKLLMKRDPVKVARELQHFVLVAMLDRLWELSIRTPIASFDGIHMHGLLRCPDHNPRIVLGIAKQYATAKLKAHGSAMGLDLNLKDGEGIWGKRSHPKPVSDPEHYDNTFSYIDKHAQRGATVIREDDSALIPDIDLLVE